MCEVETRNQNEAVGGGYFSKALKSSSPKGSLWKGKKKKHINHRDKVGGSSFEGDVD